MGGQELDAKSCTADAVFRVFTACPSDLRTLLLDVRPHKQFAKAHAATAFNVRASANGVALLDYSKNEYTHQKWSEGCWWGKHVIVYGEAGLKKDHPVVAFLLRDGQAKSLGLFREGLEALQVAYPFLVTASLKSSAARRYPSQLESHLYLGDWSHAEAVERLDEIGVKGIITVHNNPENLKVPSRFRRLAIQCADIGSADLTPHFHPSYEFIEEARLKGQGVLIHCGAGVSRSATLAMAYLMRKQRWSAQQALGFVKSRRSLIQPNCGFWRQLCALEAQLGIAERSDPTIFASFHGADFQAPKAAPTAAPRVRVTFVPAGQTSAPAGNKAETAPAAPPPPRQPEPQLRWRDGGRRSPSQEQDRGRDYHRRSRSRSGSRERSQERRRSRSRSGERQRWRSRSHSRSRSRGRDRRGGADARAQPPAASRQDAHEWVSLESTAGAVLEVVREGKQLGHLLIELSKPTQECTLGRMPSCDVVLEHLSISRQHAQLTTGGRGDLFVTDLGSAHGTNLDGMWLKAKVPRQVRVGMVLKLGASTRELRFKGFGPLGRASPTVGPSHWAGDQAAQAGAAGAAVP